MDGPDPIAVFVSSPGDVSAERLAVARVAARIEGMRDGLALSVYCWEDGAYYSAHTDFQAQIRNISDFDLVIGVFCARLGTPPPPRSPLMPDGRPYPSGSAFEILTAIAAREAGRTRPDVLVYRKTAPPAVSVKNPSLRAQQIDQMARLDAFFAEFFANPEHGVKAAFTQFETTEDFEKLFEAHLSAWIVANRRTGPPRRWRVEERGSPFVGLQPFDSAHTDVFFGRSSDVERARERLETATTAGCSIRVVQEAFGLHFLLSRMRALASTISFLLVDGASGAGKSSLVRAALVPRLLARAPGLRVAYARPGDTGGPIGALAAGLFEPAALPELASGEFPTPRDLAAHFDVGGGVAPIIRALDRAVEGSASRLLVVVDQLEEAFGADIDQSARSQLGSLLATLAGSGRVSVIATLRADAYSQAVSEPALAGLIDQGAALVLAPPGPDALAEIVRGPAAAAGIAFERNADGVSLDEVLISEAGGAAALPLLQFALARLYDRAASVPRKIDADADGPILTLRFADHAAIDGLAGAVSRQGEAAFATRPERARAALPRLVRALTDVGAPSGETALKPVLRTALVSEAAPDADARQLVDALIAARILTRNGENLRFTHEAALSAWDRAAELAARSAAFLRVRADVAAAAARWREAGERRDLLMPSGVRLAEASEALATLGSELPGEAVRLIQASQRRARRGQVATFAAAVLFAVIAAGALFFQREAEKSAVVAAEAQGAAEAQLAAAERETRRARAAELTIRAQALLDGPAGRSGTAGLLALESLRLNPSEDAHTVVNTVMTHLPSGVRDLPEAPSWSEAAIDPSGTRRLVWSSAVQASNWSPAQGELMLFDPATRIATSVAVHDGWIDLSLSPDGRVLALGGYGRRLQLLDLSTGRSVLDNPLPTNLATAFLPDGDLLVLRADGVLERRVASDWSVASSQVIAEGDWFDRRLDLAVAADGSAILARLSGAVLVGPPDGPFESIEDPGMGTAYVAVLAPTGPRVAVTWWRGVTLHDASDGTVLHTLGETIGSEVAIFSPDGRRLAVADRYGGISDGTLKQANFLSNGSATALQRSPLA
jgi:hypothetical protein